MSSLLIFAIKSAILLTLLFLPGIFLMFREKMHHFNRITLIVILLLSLVLPFCNISFLSMDNVPAVQTVEKGLLELGVPVEMPSHISIEEIENPEKGFPWFYIVSILYALGALMILGIRMHEVLSMGRIIRKGSIWTMPESDGIRIYCHAENVAPFSWFRSIVINEHDYRENGREIILHEKAHILYYHSLDIILLTMVEIIQWWNPFVYLLGIYLRDVHEYEADDYVLCAGVSPHSYSELIIRKAVGASTYAFANSFNQSLTKKRIKMMHKSSPKQTICSRVLYLVPMVALSLSVFATSKFQTASELIEQTVKSTSNTFTLKGMVPNEQNVVEYLVYIWEYFPQDELLKPVDTLRVTDGKFEYSTSLDQPYGGALKAVKKDGTTGKFFMELLFVPGENCNIKVYGEGLNEFHLSGSKFYCDWEAFGQFYKKEKEKAIALAGAGDEAYFAALADYNHKHKDEEGCIMYQYMWRYAGMDFSIADGIQQGRFKRYLQHMKILHNLETIIDIHIDADGNLYSSTNHAKLEPISSADLIVKLRQYKDVPITINLSTEKGINNVETIVRDACRQNNLMKVNYEVVEKRKK